MVWLGSLLEIIAKWSGFWINKKEREIKDRENPEKELERRKKEIAEQIIKDDEALGNRSLDDDLNRLRFLKLQGDRVGQGNQEDQKR